MILTTPPPGISHTVNPDVMYDFTTWMLYIRCEAQKYSGTERHAESAELARRLKAARKNNTLIITENFR